MIFGNDVSIAFNGALDYGVALSFIKDNGFSGIIERNGIRAKIMNLEEDDYFVFKITKLISQLEPPR